MIQRIMQLVLTASMILFSSSCTSPGKNETPPANDTPETEAKVHIVEIKQMKFEPAEIRVRKGDKVQWVNKDITNHDVTEESNKEWASSPLTTGQSWTLVVTESANYYCNLHQVMKGKIIVE